MIIEISIEIKQIDSKQCYGVSEQVETKFWPDLAIANEALISLCKEITKGG